MATSSFKDIDSEVPAETPKCEIGNAESVALVKPVPTEVVRADDAFFSNEGFEGFADKKAIEIPRISLVHSVGDLSANFTPGSIVLNGEKTLDVPLELIPLRISNFVQEYIPYNDESRKEDILKRWKTPEEARAAGFVFIWEKNRDNNEIPTCEYAASIDFLLKGYPGIADMCPVNIGEDYFLPVRLFVKGKQHRLVYNKLFTQSQFNKGAHPATFRWKMKTVRGKEGSNWVWRMHIDLAGKNTPEVFEQAKALLS